MKMLLALGLSALAAAQQPDTNPFLDQLAVRPGAVDGPLGILNGQLVTLKWGSGFVLDGSTITVQFPQFPAAPAVEVPVVEHFAITAAVPTLTLANAPLEDQEPLALYRNGLILSEGYDYTRAGAVLTFLVGADGSSNAPAPGDLFLARYRK